MSPPVYRIVLLLPDEDEVALMSELSRDPLGEVVGVLDPTGGALGTAIAEILGLPVAADPADPRLAGADYLVYPAGRPAAERLLDAARAAGHTPLSTRQFRRLLCPPVLRREAAAPPGALDALECEAREVDRALERVEEALDREALLRWLLGAALRAVGASGGSLMLHEEKTGELWVAIAHGLSEATLHTCRQRVGEGIAGRVAQRREGELLVGRPAGNGWRDRPDIESAVSVPLVRGGALLGVLNASTSAGERRLRRRDLEVLQALAPRLTRLLEGMLAIAQRRQQQEAEQLGRRLAETAAGEDLPAVLGAWAAVLAGELRAERFGLSAVCADGSLLAAESGPGPAESGVAAPARHDGPPNPAIDEVRRTGSPLILRQREAHPGELPVTVFYLPLGRQPVHAVATASFASAAAAHAFQAAAGEIVWVLQRALLELLGRIEQRDRVDRLARLATVLSELAMGSLIAGDGARLLARAAADLTGAAEAVIVRAVEGDAAIPLDEGQNGRPWLDQAGRLLEEARPDRWRVTLLGGGDDPRPSEHCVLAVTPSRTAAAPALLLLRKARLHALDGSVFTEFDGQIASRLASVLPAVLEEDAVLAMLEEAPAAGRAGARDPAPAAAAAPEPMAEPAAEAAPALPPEARPEPEAEPRETAPESEPAPQGEPTTPEQPAEPAPAAAGPAAQPADVPPAPVAEPAAQADKPAPRPVPAAASEQQEAVLDLLRREMDRADRYHTAFALIALRPLEPAWGALQGSAAAAVLRTRVRTSDAVLALPDGTVLLLAPEDVQAAARLQRRLATLLSEAIEIPAERIATAHVIHPGRREEAGALLADLLKALPPARTRGD